MNRLLFALILCLTPVSAWACSLKEGYRTPTNFELVQKADLIVLARAVTGSDDPFSKDALVELQPVKTLKGRLPDDPLRLMGGLKWHDRTVPSMPTPLATSHFSTGLGACVRLFYPKGGLVVAFFRRTPPDMKETFPYTLMPLFEPLARSAEDVESEDGVWVKAVEVYVDLQAGGDKALSDVVERKRTELLARTSDVAAEAIARDLAYYLDVTNGKKDRSGDDVQWKLFDLPDDTGAIVGSKTLKGRILRCHKGNSAMELYWPEEEGAAKALRLGNVAFPIVPAKLVLSPDMKSSSGTLAVDARLLAALQSATGQAGVEMSDRTIEAPPLDILQKFAPRCAALLSAAS